MAQVQVNISGDKEVKAFLDNLASGLADAKPLLRQIGETSKKFYSNIPFVSEGSAIGKPWQQLTPAYEERKFKLWGSKRILEASGTMMDSFEYRVTGNTMQLGNTTDYFKYHDSSKPRKKMPHRPVLIVNDLFAKQLDQDAQDFVDNHIKGS